MLIELKITPVDGVHMSRNVAKTAEVLKDAGLSFQVDPMGTCIDGDWDQVFAAIQRCHESALTDHERVITTITIDDRKHFHHGLAEMVAAVEFWGVKKQQP
jgi:uncharacterized protein (TIGR00106 family)